MKKSIDSIFYSIYKHFSIQSWFAFFSSVIVGFWAHIFILTNELCNHDDISALYVSPGFISDTRWLQSFAYYLVSPIGSGVMAGSFTIWLIGISALLVVDTLEIKSNVLSAVIGACMITTPIISSFMSYINGSYLFVIGIPFAVLAARLFDKGLKGYVLAALSLMCAISGYQSNLSIAIAIIYMILFVKLIKKDNNIKKWWISFGKAFSLLIVGLLLYIISNHIIVFFTGVGTLSGEKGFSVGVTTSNLEVGGYEAQTQLGTLFINEIPHTIIVAIKNFIKFNLNSLFDGANISFASKIITLSNAILFIVLFMIILVALINQKGIINKMMIILVALMMPLCINATQILLNGKCDETLQMMYSMVMFVPMIVVLLEQEEFCFEKIKNALGTFVFIALFLQIYANAQIDNDAYLRMNSIYESAYGEMCRVIDRVEQLPEWQNGNRCLYFDYGEDGGGYLINENYQAFRCADSYIDMGWLSVFGSEVHYFWSHNNTSKFAMCYFGLVFDSPTDEQIKNIKESDEYDELEAFPSVNAVKVIDDVIVVRMDE